MCVGKFEVHSEAVKLLESIEGDLGVVTIAGPYRTGKSSLVGRALLGNPKAFQAGATVNPCTKVSSEAEVFICILILLGTLDLRTTNQRLPHSER